MASNGHSSATAVDEELYEVEKILDVRTVAKNAKEYKVRWVGWAPEHDTWEPERNLVACQDLIEKFLRTRQSTASTGGSTKAKNAGAQNEESRNSAVVSDRDHESSRSQEDNVSSAVDIDRNDRSIGPSRIDSVIADVLQPSSTPTPTPCTPSNSDSSDSTPTPKRKRQRTQRKYWEMVPEAAANTLRDPFWKDLEEGKIDLGDAVMYERVKRNRRNCTARSTTPISTNRKRQQRGHKTVEEDGDSSMEAVASDNGPRSEQRFDQEEKSIEQEAEPSQEIEQQANLSQEIDQEANLPQEIDRVEKKVEETDQDITEKETEGDQGTEEKRIEETDQEIEKNKNEAGVDKGGSEKSVPETEISNEISCACMTESSASSIANQEVVVQSSEESGVSSGKDVEGKTEIAKPVSPQTATATTELVEGKSDLKKSPPVIEEIVIDDQEEEQPTFKTAKFTAKDVLVVCKELAKEAGKLLRSWENDRGKTKEELLRSWENDRGKKKEGKQDSNSGSLLDTGSNNDPSQLSSPPKTSLFSSGGHWRPMKRDSFSKQDSKLVIEEAESDLNETPAPPSSASGSSVALTNCPPTSRSVVSDQASSSSPPSTSIDQSEKTDGNHAASTESTLSSAPSSASPSSHFDVCQSSTEPATTELSIPDLPLPLTTNLSLSAFFKAELRQAQPQTGTLRQITSFAEFEQACCKGQVEAVRHALSTRRSSGTAIDVNGRNPISGNPLLMQVCLLSCDASHQLEDIVDLLASNGASLNARNETGDTALTMAISRNQVCKVTKLLALGAAINLPNHLGETPLMFAIKKNFPGIVHRLLEYGADFNAQSADGKTALDIAKEVAAAGGGNACETAVRDRSDKILQMFDRTLQLVVSPEKFQIVSPLFPLHCYALNESTAFRIVFYFEEHPAVPSPEMAYILAIAKARFASAQQVDVRFWGTTPVKSVILNDVGQTPVTSDGRFLYLMWPIKKGLNDLVITCNSDCKQSQHKLLIHAYALRILQI